MNKASKRRLAEGERAWIRLYGIRQFFKAIGIDLPKSFRFGSTNPVEFEESKPDVFDILQSLIDEGKRLLEAEAMAKGRHEKGKAIRFHDVESMDNQRQTQSAREDRIRRAKILTSEDPREAAEELKIKADGKDHISLTETFRQIKRAKEFLNRIGQ